MQLCTSIKTLEKTINPSKAEDFDRKKNSPISTEPWKAHLSRRRWQAPPLSFLLPLSLLGIFRFFDGGPDDLPTPVISPVRLGSGVRSLEFCPFVTGAEFASTTGTSISPKSSSNDSAESRCSADLFFMDDLRSLPLDLLAVAGSWIGSSCSICVSRNILQKRSRPTYIRRGFRFPAERSFSFGCFICSNRIFELVLRYWLWSIIGLSLSKQSSWRRIRATTFSIGLRILVSYDHLAALSADDLSHTKLDPAERNTCSDTLLFGQTSELRNQGILGLIHKFGVLDTLDNIVQPALRLCPAANFTTSLY